ncbi:MAG: hypothetical protein B6D47_13005 [Rhodocyclaceae bacterium UTPRO2]|jgi:hypothetical protein|nr:MAG: hypothetical protein B6D47_13005 [Rhodocyclaceae bacterium UTPRO2]
MSARVLQFRERGTPVLDVIRAAQAAGMHLIHNGREIRVSPIVPPGWREVIVKIKNPQRRAA